MSVKDLRLLGLRISLFNRRLHKDRAREIDR